MESPPQLSVISGKGGTGKTTITSSLAALAPRSAVLADCDVDAANLHIALRARERLRQPFSAGFVSRINQDECLRCGTCQDTCRFDAVQVEDDRYVIDPMRCEGCLACSLACPVEAIQRHAADTGTLLLSDTRYGPLVHASLRPGRESSGKLVAAVRQEALAQARTRRAGLIIIDGAPGIGCPVIATLSGVDLALLVTEPTPTGASGLERALSVAEHFGVPAVACVNRADLNPDRADAIEQFLTSRGVPLLARIPFDHSIVEATASMRPVIEIATGAVKVQLERLADLLFSRLLGDSTQDAIASGSVRDETEAK